MTTSKHAAANRQNAMRSTGPKTEEGRERAKMNALKHGLTAKTVIVSAERVRDYEGFRDAMFEDCAPEGTLECLLVERIVICAWRLRRAVRKEADMDRESAESEVSSFEERHLYGKSQMDDLVDARTNLLRYETAIERGFYRAIHNLERLQARRKGQDVAAPLAIDIGHDPKRETS